MRNPNLPWYEWDDKNETLDECRERRLMQMPVLSGAELEVLRQCHRMIWDGYLASKDARSSLLRKGLVAKWEGWQVITREGMAVLHTLGELEGDKYEGKPRK